MTRKTINGQLLLDVAGASALLGMSERALRAHVRRRQVPFRKLEGRVVFDRQELEQFVSELPGCSLAEVKANREVRE